MCPRWGWESESLPQRCGQEAVCPNMAACRVLTTTIPKSHCEGDLLSLKMETGAVEIAPWASGTCSYSIDHCSGCLHGAALLEARMGGSTEGHRRDRVDPRVLELGVTPARGCGGLRESLVRICWLIL